MGIIKTRNKKSGHCGKKKKEEEEEKEKEKKKAVDGFFQGMC